MVVVVNDMSWDVRVAPVGIGAILLAPFAFAWHSLVARGANKSNTWPAKWRRGRSLSLPICVRAK